MSDFPTIDDSLDSAPYEATERDENTDDMFGDLPVDAPRLEPTVVVSEPEKSPENRDVAYTVLARKYRPRTFEDLIGQEAMVKTLTNAFATGRIAHAFMLTGVRGVGKTTTARLLARALNFESDTVRVPSVDLSVNGRHCQAIYEGRHIDVLEMDAASRTGVDAMRDLLDSARYGAAEARYKVYVLDEVHMLSTAAFNALLKTLEEPPAHVKFIFATTEIRKVPVTILSRCQRFDLRRVEPEVLTPHLEKICALEGANIEPDALSLIARAAEGSVRDGLSLLDQALVQNQAGEKVSVSVVRDMLGLADASATLGLFENIISGQISDALLAYRTLYGFGADPIQLMNDLLEYCHGCSVAKVLGAQATRMPKDQATRMAALGGQLSAGTLSHLWTLMLKAFEEIRRAPDPNAAFEMAMVRFCYVSDLPGPEVLLKRLQNGQDLLGGGGGSGGGSPSGVTSSYQTAVAQQVKPQAKIEEQIQLNSFADVIALIEQKRDIGLRVDVERYIRLVSFKVGAITFEPAPNTPIDLVRKLSMRLKEWTGQRWLIVTEGGGGAESVYEREKRQLDAARTQMEVNPFVMALTKAFPGLQITGFRQKPQPVIAPALTQNADEETLDKDDD